MTDLPASAPTDSTGSCVGSSELMGLLRRIDVEAQKFTDTFAESHDLHRTDLAALSALMDAAGSSRPLSAGELSEELHLSAPATTALLDRLVRAGYVERRRNTGDRRVVEIVMSERAREVGRELFRPLGVQLRAAMEGYDESELTLVSRFLQDVLTATIRARRTCAPASGSIEPGPQGPTVPSPGRSHSD